MAKQSLPNSISIDNLTFGEMPKHPLFVDRTGWRVGSLTLLGFHKLKGNSIAYWYCQCDCGNIVSIRWANIQSGDTKTCGCSGPASKTHGMSGTRVYLIWCNMRNRCTNPKRNNYSDYGGRGITFCERWASFDNFLADMGEPPSDQHSLDRIDSNGNYEPSNCRWATTSEQLNNKRTTRWIEINGRTQSLAQWCREFGLNSGSVRGKLRRGATVEEAFGIERVA